MVFLPNVAIAGFSKFPLIPFPLKVPPLGLPINWIEFSDLYVIVFKTLNVTNGSEQLANSSVKLSVIVELCPPKI